MPRAPQPGREIRRRSRNGCWNCKARKVKCGEEKPRCANCTRLDEDCDYKIRLSWGGRPLKKKLLEQGAQLDDPSQNIPGAGQFSLHQFNPIPSQAQQQRLNPTPSASSSTHNNHTTCTSRPSVSRKSSKTGHVKSQQQQQHQAQQHQHQHHQQPTQQKTVFQNVFPVCGVTSQPLMSNNNSMSGSPFYASPTYPHHQYPGMWSSEPEQQSPLTPATLSGDNHFGVKEETSYHSFPGRAGSFATHVASPTPSLSNIAMSPDTANSSMPSPQQSYTDHIVYNQHKASVSSDMGMHPETTAAMSSGIVVPSSGPLGHPLEYITGPLTPPQMSTDVHPYGMKENSRRLSVQNLLTTPLPSSQDFAAYQGNGYNQAIDPQLNDGDIEEIPRYDESLNFGDKKKYQDQQQFATNGNGHPVYQSIPRSLHPLPTMLMDNVESAMYFHHFLTQTASMLVPHDCGRNPFKTILPQSTSNDNQHMHHN